MEFLQKDIVVFRDKTEGVVADDAIVRIDERGDWDWICLDDFMDDGTSKICDDWDIMEIQRKERYEQCYTTVFNRGVPLEDGDIVMLKDGDKGVVVSERIIFPGCNAYISLSDYKGYTHYDDSDCDIDRHYRFIDGETVLLGKGE